MVAMCPSVAPVPACGGGSALEPPPFDWEEWANASTDSTDSSETRPARGKRQAIRADRPLEYIEWGRTFVLGVNYKF